MKNADRKSLRTLMQLMVSGAFTTLVAALAGKFTAADSAVVLAVSQIFVTYAHNWLEDHEVIPTILRRPTPAKKEK